MCSRPLSGRQSLTVAKIIQFHGEMLGKCWGNVGVRYSPTSWRLFARGTLHAMKVSFSVFQSLASLGLSEQCCLDICHVVGTDLSQYRNSQQASGYSPDQTMTIAKLHHVKLLRFDLGHWTGSTGIDLIVASSPFGFSQHDLFVAFSEQRYPLASFEFFLT